VKQTASFTEEAEAKTKRQPCEQQGHAKVSKKLGGSSPAGQPFVLKVTPASGEVIEVLLPTDATVKEAKAAIQQKAGHLAEAQQLFAGVKASDDNAEVEEPLKDDAVVKQVAVGGNALHLLIRGKCARCDMPHEEQNCSTCGDSVGYCCKKCVRTCTTCGKTVCKVMHP
jgi:hypothetical protein